jgi:uncharacterized protein YceH (UPF0502 family)
VLQAVISRQGTIENLRVPTGHPMSVRAAIDAVIQRHDRSYVLNNEPVEVEMQITVNFLSPEVGARPQFCNSHIQRENHAGVAHA